MLSRHAVWEASGHIANFTDPLSECRNCNKRVRVDKLIAHVTEAAAREGKTLPAPVSSSLADMARWIADTSTPCPHCGVSGEKGLSAPRDVNLLFSTRVGPVTSDAAVHTTGPADASSTRTNDEFGVTIASGKQKGQSPGRTSPRMSEDVGGLAYLRPETAQGVYVQFGNIANSMRARLPFGTFHVSVIVPASMRNSACTHAPWRTPYL